MSKDKDSQLVFISCEDVAGPSFVYFCGYNIEVFDKQYIVTDIESESIIPSMKKNLFHHRMVDFVNKLE